MKTTAKGAKRFAAIDALVILLLLLCVAGIAVRMAIGPGGLLSSHDKGDYIVSYIVTGIRGEYSDCFSEGKEFFFEDGEHFGTLTAGAVFTPARLYGEDADGKYVPSYASDGRVDVRGTALCEGKMTDEGFLLGGSIYAAANSQFTVSSADITVDIVITDIAKAQ